MVYCAVVGDSFFDGDGEHFFSVAGIAVTG